MPKSSTQSRADAITLTPTNRSWLLVSAILLLLAAPCVFAQGNYAERFDRAWTLVDERYWNIEAIDWQAVKGEYREDAIAASSEEEFYGVLERMYEELDDDHSVFVPPERVAEIREQYGDLPCLPVLAQSDPTWSPLLARGDSNALPLLAQSGPTANIGRVTFRLIGEVGYLRVPDLASPWIAADTRDVVATLVSGGAGALVLDLRGNPGGRLVEMMQMAGIFTRGFLWRVVTRWSLPIPYPAIGTVETELPLAILTDGGVNSAAEGLAGALQQVDRAVIVGEPTAGNVEAVLPFCLRDGSQAWIATGVLAPIGAPTWEGEGVLPDVPADADQALEAALRYLRSE